VKKSLYSQQMENMQEELNRSSFFNYE